MEEFPVYPNIILDIKPEGDFEFWSHITVVDGLGRTTFQQVVNNETTIDLGNLEHLKGSILHVTGAAENVAEFQQGAINYTLIYAGSPGEAPDQANRVGAEVIRRGIFGFLLRFCPRHPFC